MKICGIKLTHDAAIAVIDTKAQKLLFSIEIEKLNNNPRYSSMPIDTRIIGDVLASEDLSPDEIDQWVVDGWRNASIASHGMRVAGYHEFDGIARNTPICSPLQLFSAYPPLNVATNRTVLSISTLHLQGHIIGSYFASPFAKTSRRAFVLVWDGGCDPRLYHVNPRARRGVPKVEFVGVLGLGFYGFMYGLMGSYFGPYAKPGIEQQSILHMDRATLLGGREAPGKLMSWIAHGRPSAELMRVIFDAYNAVGGPLAFDCEVGDVLDVHQTGFLEHSFLRELQHRLKDDYAPEDVLATLHDFMGSQLVSSLGALIAAKYEAFPGGDPGLIFTGGCALNIKWNSALRHQWSEVWVPPFCNDTGAALGAAATSWASADPNCPWQMDWSVYSGPRLYGGNLTKAATAFNVHRGFTIEQLAGRFMAYPERPVVFLEGRAEIGPRALGARSILAAPWSARMRLRLNELKRREPWRPVAPVCPVEHAGRYFTPGTEDPYMLFDHSVLPHARTWLGAVTHMDGTARLQTVNANDAPTLHRLLSYYFDLSGNAVLCNTSANELGAGFFPDVESALAWAAGRGVDVYANQTLYEDLK